MNGEQHSVLEACRCTDKHAKCIGQYALLLCAGVARNHTKPGIAVWDLQDYIRQHGGNPDNCHDKQDLVKHASDMRDKAKEQVKCLSSQLMPCAYGTDCAASCDSDTWQLFAKQQHMDARYRV